MSQVQLPPQLNIATKKKIEALFENINYITLVTYMDNAIHYYCDTILKEIFMIS